MHMGADVNIGVSADGIPPIYVASQRGHLEVVKTLIHYQADIARTTADGWSALLVASSFGHIDVVRTLLESGANPDQEDAGTFSRLP